MNKRKRKKAYKHMVEFYATGHVQVPFTTCSGVRTLVDQGMLDVLTELAEHGVETDYSCQGATFGAYVCGSTESFRPLILRVLRTHSYWGYRDEQHALVDAFIYHPVHNPYAFFELGLTRVPRTTRGDEVSAQNFSYERKTNNLYGDRTVLRWPKNRTQDVFELLKATPGL